MSKSKLFPLISDEEFDIAEKLAAKHSAQTGRTITVDDVLLASNLSQMGERVIEEAAGLNTRATRELVGQRTAKSTGSLLILAQSLRQVFERAGEEGRTVNDVAVDVFPSMLAILAGFSAPKKLKHRG